MVKSFQQIIFDLQNFWATQGCTVLQPIDTEVGAGTLHPATVLRALGKNRGKLLMFNLVVALLTQGLLIIQIV